MVRLVSPTMRLQHQQQALIRCRNRPAGINAYAYLMETGTGKTKVVLDEYQDYVADADSGIRDLLVIAPAGSIRNWFARKADDQPSEIEKHFDPKLVKSLSVANWGNKPAERRAVEALVQEVRKPRALFVNIEALSTDESPAYKLCVKFLKHGHALMVIDESTTIRNKAAARTKQLVKLGAMAAARRIMTGLVTPKSPMDLYWQFYFLDPTILGYESFVAFRARYAKVKYQCYLPNAVIKSRLQQFITVAARRQGANAEAKLYHTFRGVLNLEPSYRFKNPKSKLVPMVNERLANMQRDEMLEVAERIGCYTNQVPIIEEYLNLTELQQKIAPFSFQVLKKDCLNLLPKTYEPREVQLTDEQRHLYKEILENATAQLESLDHVTAESVVVQIMRLHQIVCGHVRDEERKLHDVKSNRISAIIEVLDDYAGKAIIWTTYTHEIMKIKKALDKEYGAGSCSMFYGGNKTTRQTDETRFLEDPECRFMVATQAAGGRGNTWNVAAMSIYAANSYDLEMRFQSEDRNHRIGQQNAVTYIDLITKNTVEEKIIQCLRRKLDLATIITNENYREWLI